MVELKNGETYNGILAGCDAWMNVHLREAICTSRDGAKFTRLPEAYLRGNTIKYLRVPDEALAKACGQLIEARTDLCVLNGRAAGEGFSVCGGADAVSQWPTKTALCAELVRLLAG